MAKKSGFGRYRLLLLCTFLSFLAWFAVKLSKNYVQDYQKRLVFINLPEQKALSYQSDSLLTLKIKGKGLSLLGYELKGKTVKIDFEEITTKEQQRRNYIIVNKKSITNYLTNQLGYSSFELVDFSNITLELEPVKD